MKTKKLKTRLVKCALIFSAIFAFTSVSFATENEVIKFPKDTVFITIDKAPEFPGGMNALGQFFSDNIRYPAKARKNGEQGRVIVQFVIDETGKIIEVEIFHSVSPALDKEAIRLIKSMPKWTPGEHEGEKVRVRYTLPVNFRFE